MVMARTGFTDLDMELRIEEMTFAKDAKDAKIFFWFHRNNQ